MTEIRGPSSEPMRVGQFPDPPSALPVSTVVLRSPGGRAPPDAAGDESGSAAACLPLAAGECAALAAAVLDVVREDRRGPEDADRAGAASRRFSRAFDRFPRLADWIAVNRAAADAVDRAGILEWLRDRIAFDGIGAHAGVAVPSPPAEGQALLAALALAIDHVRLEERFQEAVAEARLEAMRELAYGAGHEINNPLANIATRAQALLLEETDPERRRRLSTIVDQAFRARDMIGGLMIFARPPRPVPAAVDAHPIVTAVIESVRAAATARGVRLEYSPAPAPRAVFVDRVQVEEAVRAVVVNAIEAVAAGGRVVIAVQAAAAGSGMEIVVADDGAGMSPEQVRRAFDPFYSGREAGRGAGLGLAKAWRLVGGSDGSIAIDSRPGGGTRVTIALPAAAPGLADVAAKSTQTALLRWAAARG